MRRVQSIWRIMLIISLVFYQCNSGRDHKQTIVRDEFDIDFSESASALKSKGFKEMEQPYHTENYIFKKSGDVLVGYSVDPERNIVYGKSIVSTSIGVDSVSVAKWLEKNGAFMWSPIFNTKTGTGRFFAKSYNSGLLFSGFIKKNYVILYIDFPNTDSFDRTKRIITKDGMVIIRDSMQEVNISRDEFNFPE